MKSFFIATTLCLLATSCTQVAGWFGSKDENTAKAPVDSIDGHHQFVRDESITEANAYSDLFLEPAVVDSFIAKEKLDDSTAQHLRQFYAVRNFQYAWFHSSGITEQGRGFWGLSSHKSAEKDTLLRARMDTLIQKDSLQIAKTDTAFAEVELHLTKQFIQYAAQNKDGWMNGATIYQAVPAKKLSPMQLADSILHQQNDTLLYRSNKDYTALKTALAVYYNAAKDSLLKPLTRGKKLSKGSTSPLVSALKKRMAGTNDYSLNDTSSLFNDSLLIAIKDYQTRNGLAPTGAVNDSLVASLNVPAQERVGQILVNLNRMLWMKPIQDSSYVVVNIPSYMLYVYTDTGKLMEMPIVVGKEGSSTVMFTDAISQVVFAPYWRLPKSIIRNEIMPKMKEDPGYLKKRNMEIVDQKDSIPQIRQLPGKENALGQVKFLFPNSFDIYLHDTPDKTLFAKKDRALSHGCIRVADPVALAQFLLPDWTKEKIVTAMNGKEEQKVQVKKDVPVQINYYTAWAGADGKVYFRPDVYGHDEQTGAKMFIDRKQTGKDVAVRQNTHK